MDNGCIIRFQWAHWPWCLAGALVGLWLVPLARSIPRKVLQRANVSMYAWQGPGGGIADAIPSVRSIWVPLVNAGLWACAANTAGNPVLLAPLLQACLASTLVLLALVDWDSTLLPDRLVIPLGVAGLAASHAGFTRHTLFSAALYAVVVLGLLGGLAWLFWRIRGVNGIGGGDLKLLAALATWLGLAGVLYVVVWACAVTVVWYLAWRRFKSFSPQAEWPFGPAIVIAALLWSLPIW